MDNIARPLGRGMWREPPAAARTRAPRSARKGLRMPGAAHDFHGALDLVESGRSRPDPDLDDRSAAASDQVSDHEMRFGCTDMPPYATARARRPHADGPVPAVAALPPHSVRRHEAMCSHSRSDA